MVPGSDYIDKPLRTTTGYTPPVQGATPATTGGYPNPVTDPEGYKKAINQGLLKKYAGDAQPAAASATPATTKGPIYRGSESGKDYVNPAQPRGAQPAAASATPSAPVKGSPTDPEKVRMLQQNLKAAGANLGTTGPNKDGVDGEIGNLTRQAMEKYPTALKGYPWMTGLKMKESSDLARIRHLAGLTRN
jgi:hypothetical protein